MLRDVISHHPPYTPPRRDRYVFMVSERKHTNVSIIDAVAVEHLQAHSMAPAPSGETTPRVKRFCSTTKPSVSDRGSTPRSSDSELTPQVATFNLLICRRIGIGMGAMFASQSALHSQTARTTPAAHNILQMNI